ncbi:hypothetical protein LCGC14_1344090 [marine sediment metagenome]|uniref:Uncharacterized protein n=1 Tax=marine sediment metagenome TaxID=412755 RepID=A0A0F9KZ12_9ZZZZ
MANTLLSLRQFLTKFLVLNFKVSNSVFKDCDLFMLIIRNKLKVLYSVVVSILSALDIFFPCDELSHF